MEIDELIKFCKRKSENIKLKAEPQVFVEIAEKLEELKNKDLEEQGLIVKLPCKMVGNPLEPLKLYSALQSEILKYEYRKEHKPQDISQLDYTIMYALKHCLEKQTAET